MDIFIWASYGDVEVYAAESVADLTSILDNIISVVTDWGVDEDIKTVDTFVQKDPHNPARLRKAINHLLNIINIGSHESFEHGTGFSKLIYERTQNEQGTINK